MRNQNNSYIYPCITTSWDDGHPLDFRLADLLARYDLKATFYIPRYNQEHTVMSEADVAALSQSFEIGGHTLNHLSVPEVTTAQWETEVRSCRSWLEDVTGSSPVTFCFPKGKYTATTAAAVFNNGFKLARTTALFSTSALPANAICGTTLQLYPHSKTTYIKHLAKRSRFGTLASWLSRSGTKELETLTDFYLQQALATGGCFHLWGHSWELEEFGLWNKLEQVCKRLARLPEFNYIENRHLIT